MLNPQAAAKKPYIPTKGIKAKTTAVPKLPEELVRLSVDVAMRSIPWVESAPRPAEAKPAATAPRVQLDARTTVRIAFGVEVAWTGERTAAPSAAQTVKSLKTVFAQFQWE